MASQPASRALVDRPVAEPAPAAAVRADDDVEPPEPLEDVPHLTVVGEVGDVRDDALAGRHAGHVAVDREHGVTGGRERRCDRASDAATGAGHKCDRAVLGGSFRA